MQKPQTYFQDLTLYMKSHQKWKTKKMWLSYEKKYEWHLQKIYICNMKPPYSYLENTKKSFFKRTKKKKQSKYTVIIPKRFKSSYNMKVSISITLIIYCQYVCSQVGEKIWQKTRQIFADISSQILSPKLLFQYFFLQIFLSQSFLFQTFYPQVFCSRLFIPNFISSIFGQPNADSWI